MRHCKKKIWSIHIKKKCGFTTKMDESIWPVTFLFRDRINRVLSHVVLTKWYCEIGQKNDNLTNQNIAKHFATQLGL